MLDNTPATLAIAHCRSLSSVKLERTHRVTTLLLVILTILLQSKVHLKKHHFRSIVNLYYMLQRKGEDN